MNRILFPIDFSESANNALNYASEYAKGNNAELVLYNAYGIFEPEDLENTVEKLQSLANDINKTYNIYCRIIAEPTLGDLSKHISNAAQAYDLVIMGTKGANNFFQSVRGSNSYNATLKADVPFLIIPVIFKGTAITNVVFAYDYLKAGKVPAQQLKPFLRTLGSNKSLTVLRINESAIPSNIESLTREASSPLMDIKDGLEVKFESVDPVASTVADAIDQYMTKTNNTALCLCTQRRDFVEDLFHKSVIKKVSASAKYPIFVFHH